MLNISKSIRTLNDNDIADNIFYYDYNTRHLMSLLKKGVDEEDTLFLSSYRSFEGEVFENFIYEKLLRYAEKSDEIEQFILKGYHQNRKKAFANTLSISEKQQIVYRTKSKEISEFDAMFTTKDNELYFVEMTLVKSVLKLRKRLRKKKALLEIIFPNLEIKALIILNDGASGTKQFPSYCKVWFTQEFSAGDVLEFLKDKSSKKLQPKVKIKSSKMTEAHSLKVHPFRYYNTMIWITKILRAHKKHILDISFLMKPTIQRYHDLYNKLYIGYIDIKDATTVLGLDDSISYEDDQRVVLAIEKKYNDEIVLTYYIQTGRKKLYLYSLDDSKVTREKKDPFGITVTEVYHINRMMDDSYKLNIANINIIVKLLRESFLKQKNITN